MTTNIQFNSLNCTTGSTKLIKNLLTKYLQLTNDPSATPQIYPPPHIPTGLTSTEE